MRLQVLRRRGGGRGRKPGRVSRVAGGRRGAAWRGVWYAYGVGSAHPVERWGCMDRLQAQQQLVGGREHVRLGERRRAPVDNLRRTGEVCGAGRAGRAAALVHFDQALPSACARWNPLPARLGQVRWTQLAQEDDVLPRDLGADEPDLRAREEPAGRKSQGERCRGKRSGSTATPRQTGLPTTFGWRMSSSVFTSRRQASAGEVAAAARDGRAGEGLADKR